VYIYDAAKDALLPHYPDVMRNPRHYTVFFPGVGATGTAFKDDAPVVVLGDAVSNAQFGLSEEQQRRYAAFEVVAAAPIRNLADEPIGCVTFIAERNDGFFAAGDGEIRGGIQALQELADKIGDVIQEA
jgi:hypothetical protein